MKTPSRFFLCVAARRGGRRAGPDSGDAAQAAHRRLAHLQRRLFRPPLQPAQADQFLQRPHAVARLGHRASAAAEVRQHPSIKSTPLMVNGILYFTAPNHVWAADARTGRELWHYQYPPNTGSTIGNRGVGMYGNWLFFESPDSNLISLDARTGKERWKVSTRRSQAGLHLDSGAGGHRQSRHRRHRRRPSG